MDDRNKWLLYEREKIEIQNQNLPQREYEMRIQELLDILDL